MNFGGVLMKQKTIKKFSKKISLHKPSFSFSKRIPRGALTSVKFVVFGLITFLLSTGTAYGWNGQAGIFQRHLASTNFPLISTERSTSDILDSYPAYLKFVLEVGKDTNRAQATKLAKIYDSLKRKNPKSAALFLKGLRFEMVQKVELMGKDPRTLSSSNPELRSWIGRYLVEWVREADEHLFRAYSASRSELALSE